MFIIMNDCDKELSLELGIKRLASDAEQFDGTRDVAVALIHHLVDMSGLDALQSLHFLASVDGIF